MGLLETTINHTKGSHEQVEPVARLGLREGCILIAWSSSFDLVRKHTSFYATQQETYPQRCFLFNFHIMVLAEQSP
jgi:hypothetical protein